MTNFFPRVKELRSDSDVVCNCPFIIVVPRDCSALLARAHNYLSQDFIFLWENSAHFEGKDCFECLSPQEIAA